MHLAEKHGFGHSQPYLRVLRFLMTPEQAEMVAKLPVLPPGKRQGEAPANVISEVVGRG